MHILIIDFQSTCPNAALQLLHPGLTLRILSLKIHDPGFGYITIQRKYITILKHCCNSESETSKQTPPMRAGKLITNSKSFCRVSNTCSSCQSGLRYRQPIFGFNCLVEHFSYFSGWSLQKGSVIYV